MLASMAAARETDEKGDSWVSAQEGSAIGRPVGESGADRPEDESRVYNISIGPRLIARAQGGDPAALQALFHRYGRPVLAFIYHMTGDRAAAEDLTQETFFRACRGLARVRDEVKFSTWLFGIARNVAREALRERSRSARVIGSEELSAIPVPDEKADPEEALMSDELQRLIRISLRELPEDQRVVFILKLLGRMSYEEISLITGASIGKLKTDLHRARLRMRERLLPYLAAREPGM